MEEIDLEKEAMNGGRKFLVGRSIPHFGSRAYHDAIVESPTLGTTFPHFYQPLELDLLHQALDFQVFLGAQNFSEKLFA